MATPNVIPPLPKGYQLDQAASVPPLPKGYSLDSGVDSSQPTEFEKRGGFSGNERFADPIPETGLLSRATNFIRGGVSAITAPILHPVETVEGMGKGLIAGGMTPYGAPLHAPTGDQARDAATEQAYRNTQQEVVQGAGQEVKDHPSYVVGQIVGPVLAGEGIRAGLKTPTGLKASSALAKTTGVIAKTAGTGIQAAKSLVDPTMIAPEDAAMKGLKPKNSITGARDKIAAALPEMKQVAQQKGIDFSQVPDEQLHSVAEDLAQVAAKQKWEQISAKLEKNGTKTVSAEPLADAIQSKIDGLSDIAVSENPAAVKSMGNKVQLYRGQDLSVAKMETRIQELNNKLRSEQGKLKVDEGALRRDPNYAGDFAELDTLRKMQDDVLTQAGDSVRDLKKQYGALKEVRGMIERNKNVAERASAQPLFEGLGRMAGAGNVVGGTLQVARGVVTGSGEALGGGLSNVAKGAAQFAIGRKASLMNNRNFLLRHALETTPLKPSVKISSVWPQKYSASPKQLTPNSGGGANYSAADLAAFKKKNGIQ